MQSDFTLN